MLTLELGQPPLTPPAPMTSMLNRSVGTGKGAIRKTKGGSATPEEDCLRTAMAPSLARSKDAKG